MPWRKSIFILPKDTEINQENKYYNNFHSSIIILLKLAKFYIAYFQFS